MAQRAEWFTETRNRDRFCHDTVAVTSFTGMINIIS
jgi:hypothetical protein